MNLFFSFFSNLCVTGIPCRGSTQLGNFPHRWFLVWYIHMFAYSFVPLVCFVEVDSCFILSLLFSQESNWITCYLERKTFHPSIIRRWLQIFLFQDREHLLFSLSPEASDAKKKRTPKVQSKIFAPIQRKSVLAPMKMRAISWENRTDDCLWLRYKLYDFVHRPCSDRALIYKRSTTAACTCSVTLVWFGVGRSVLVVKFFIVPDAEGYKWWLVWIQKDTVGLLIIRQWGG
jgi:hypothetical protein